MNELNHQNIVFPVGYYELHKNQVYNFQLNRWHSLGFTRLTDLEEIGKNVKTFEDWKIEMVKHAEKAVLEKRILNAAFYYRSAEFYTMQRDNPGKEYYYDKFIEFFYKGVENEPFERIQVPYKSVYLPVLKMTPNGDKKGTIVLHGGFDSFIEEWFYIMKYFLHNGYEVIGFEGPGQGNVLLKQNCGLDYHWEKPVKTLLDYFKLENATLFGLSMGGWFCLRAAAFEKRIKNVIASGHAVDYSHIPPPFMRWLMMFFIKYLRAYSRKSFEKMMNKGGMQSWQVSNLAHISKLPPLEAFEYSLNLNEENLHCEKIDQNVLYLTGKNDHFVPFKMHAWQLKLLKNAHLTDRVFTRKEHADNHCQIGNIRLMLDTIVDWLKDK